MGIKDQLKESILELRLLEKVHMHHTSISKQLIDDVSSLDRLEKQLKKESRDVDRLEKTSITSLFHKTFGDRNAKLEKERKEYVAVSLKYNELAKSINLLEYELDLMSKKLGDKQVLENKIDALMKRREKELMQQSPQVRTQLSQLNEQIDRSHIFVKDIDEAFAAGGQALQLLQSMIGQLRSARNWGQYDMMSDNRSIGYKKSSAINKASRLAIQAKQLLRRFEDELKDVYRDLKINFRIQIEGSSQFADVFFDNLITDFIIQQKIKKSLDSVMRVADQVEGLMRGLQNEKPKVAANLLEIEKQREKIILNAK